MSLKERHKYLTFKKIKITSKRCCEKNWNEHSKDEEGGNMIELLHFLQYDIMYKYVFFVFSYSLACAEVITEKKLKHFIFEEIFLKIHNL